MRYWFIKQKFYDFLIHQKDFVVSVSNILGTKGNIFIHSFIFDIH